MSTRSCYGFAITAARGPDANRRLCQIQAVCYIQSRYAELASEDILLSALYHLYGHGVFRLKLQLIFSAHARIKIVNPLEGPAGFSFSAGIPSKTAKRKVEEECLFFITAL
jgi:hypothetical protein